MKFLANPSCVWPLFPSCLQCHKVSASTVQMRKILVARSKCFSLSELEVQSLFSFTPERLYIRNVDLPSPCELGCGRAAAGSSGCFRCSVGQSKISRRFYFVFSFGIHSCYPISLRSCSSWALMEWQSPRKGKLMISVLKEEKRKGVFCFTLY